VKLKLTLKDTLILVCVVYTVLTLASSTLGLMAGRTTDTHAHLLLRFAIVSAGIGSLLVFSICEKWSPLAQAALHYVVTIGMVLWSGQTERIFLRTAP
jgi:CHASE2 domain-containing sensor protein